jgi:heat shock protein HslJ
MKWMMLAAAAVSLAMAQDPLDYTKWKLTESSAFTALPSRGATVLFDQGRYSIQGCNRINGGYRLEGSKLVVTRPGITTQMACPGDAGQLDKALSEAISNNEGFQLEGERLTLTGPEGAKFVFRKEPLPSKSAVTKFIYVAAFTKPCTGVAPMNCLQIREKESDPWRLNYNPIIGFEHVPGIEYRLRIKEDKREDPPADASRIVWYLDQVVMQKVVDRQAASEARKKRQ